MKLPGIKALLVAAAAAVRCAAAVAAVEVNTASVADLDGVKGIGPALSAKILQAREKGPFQNWPDLVGRVPGLGKASAARLSSEGLTVNGAAFDGARAAAVPSLPMAGASR
ncbi:helix-hairpin-helix domain-containing protein [Acidovorax sp. SUPP1855]|uniref:ComEA family DNA-binding protein n=1 Tax=Acidovorax sp. SUPP1855 TaxID=431774 RepID=UPI0023DE269F|nr:helix-hairpin-helix domain-containing protein [Acidovorax sp. SUPP1855]GKS86522.1 helix-hairpin-helix domain-containing protein [Acidovorax sp. SUPP1855]